MQNSTIDSVTHACLCGAACAPTNTRCKKCIARTRWLRRKAWRTGRGDGR